MTHSNTKVKATVREFMDERSGLRIIEWMSRIDVDHARPERDLMGHLSEGCTPSHIINYTRAIDTVKAFVFELLGEF
jgi:hypothetical protein